MARTTEIKMEVKDVLGVVAQHGSNSLELRMVSWNDAEPKYDLRTWYVDREGNERCNKGLGMTKEEIVSLRDLLNSLELD